MRRGKITEDLNGWMDFTIAHLEKACLSDSLGILG